MLVYSLKGVVLIYLLRNGTLPIFLIPIKTRLLYISLTKSRCEKCSTDKIKLGQ